MATLTRTRTLSLTLTLTPTLTLTLVAAKDSVYRDRERVRLAPPDDELILASDSLVVLAEDQAAAAEG